MAWFFNRRSSSSSHHKPSYARSSSSSWSRSSSYRRRPRDGYVERLVYKFKHLVRELWYYLRRNPVKVFFFVIMPLISGGALAAFARQFGVRLPDFLSGKGAREMGGAYDGYYGSKGYGSERGGGIAGGLGGADVGSMLKIAKMFL